MFACQKEESSQISELETKVVHFYAGELETKTAFGDRTSEGKYPTLWTANDSKVKISLNYATEKSATVKVADDKKTASFDAEIVDDASGSYTFYALSPATASYAQYNEDTKTVGITIPSSQTPSENSVDELAQVLVAKSSTTDVFPENVELPFTHVLAYGRMSLTNLDLDDVVISSVSITASKNISGRYTYSPETDELTENSASSSISILTSSSSDIWFACAPVDLSDGGTMQVVVSTNKGTFTKNITFPAGKGNFEAGHVAKFSVNMDGISLVSPKEFSLVKSKSELTVGSEVIIVASDFDYAISTTQYEKNRDQAKVVKTDETIVCPAVNVQVVTLEKGNQENTASLKVNDSYLYSVSGQNQLKTGYLNDAASWVISVSAEGVASINNYANKDYYIMYNSSDKIFSCYKGTQKSVSVYKLNGSGSATQIFLPVLDSPVLTVSTDNLNKEITVSWEDVENATSYDVVCGSKNATIEPDVETASFEMDSYGSFEISVTAKADGYQSATATASATLLDPNDTKKYYVKVTSAPADWSGTYLLVFDDDKAHSYVVDSDLASKYNTILTIEDDKILSVDSVDQDAVVISKKGAGYKIKLSNDKYITVPASNKVGNNTEANASELTVEYTASGVKISGKDSKEDIRYLCRNGNYFRMYKDIGSFTLPVLYKLQED